MTLEGATQDAPASSESYPAPPQSDNGPTPNRARIRNGVIIAATTLLLLEAILRAMGIANPLLYDVDPNVGYRIQPSQNISYFRNPITINEFGVRDPRPLTSRDPKKKRVLCLGDSVTWGGVYERQENLFTSVAERRLGNVEIINAGVNGYSVHQMVELYKNHLTGLDPDLVVLCVIVRDFERVPVTKLTGSGVAFPTQKPPSAIIEALRICQLTAYERWGIAWLEPPAATQSQWTENEPLEDANLASVTELAKTLQGRSKFVVLFLPVESGERTRLRHEFARTLSTNGVRVATLNAEPDKRTDYIDGVHLATSGHNKVGGALAAFIDNEFQK